MSLFPILSIILPLVGACGTLGLSLVPRVRPYARYVALAAVALTTILLLTFAWTEPVTVILSLWQPSLLFGAALTLQADVLVQPLALVLALTTCSALLVDLSRAEESSPWLAATSLALLSAGVVALWSANLLTMIVSWAVYDLVQALGRIVAGGSERAAIRNLVFGSLATLLLWSGALLSEGGADNEMWALMAVGNIPLTLGAGAAILRLWVYPFHLPTPDDLDTTSSLATPLLLSPIIGWGLWLRLAQANGGFIPGNSWVTIIAAITLAVGGFLAWSCNSPRRTLPWIGMAVTGAVLLAAGLAGQVAVIVIAAGSVAWALGMAVLSLSDGLQRASPQWSIPALVGVLSLLGVPFTLGFVTVASSLRGLTEGGRLGLGGGFFVGYLLLVPSLVRWLLASPSFSLPSRRELLVLRGVGLGLPALLLIVGGLYPPLLSHDALVPTQGSLFAAPGMAGWLLWAVSLAGGGILAWQEANLRSKIALWFSAAHDLLRLEWFYGVLMGAMDRGMSVLRAADEVVGGAGALLWSWLLFLLLLLVWVGK